MELIDIPATLELFDSKSKIIPPIKNSQKTIFRPINYLGSKLRMLDFIETTINSLSPSGGVICDLFAGSGSVSKRLSDNRAIISSDIQEYSRVICSALLKPDTFIDVNVYVEKCENSDFHNKLKDACDPIIRYEKECILLALEGQPSLLCEFLEEGSLIKSETENYKKCSSRLEQALKDTNTNLSTLLSLNTYDITATRYFGGIYFSFEQTVALDAIYHGIASQPKKSHDTLLAALLGTASNIVNTVGKQFAQPIQPRATNGLPKKGIGSRANKDRSLCAFSSYKELLKKYIAIDKNNFPHQALKMDFLDALDNLPPETSVVYADPPYTRDHYSRFYHVLETLCLRDSPEISTVTIKGDTKLSRGLYREDRHQSPFCIRSTAPAAFEALFKKVAKLNASLVLSYSPFTSDVEEHPRVMTISSLIDLAKVHFKSVEQLCPGTFKHNKLNNRENSFDEKTHGELLIVCTN